MQSIAPQFVRTRTGIIAALAMLVMLVAAGCGSSTSLPIGDGPGDGPGAPKGEVSLGTASGDGFVNGNLNFGAVAIGTTATVQVTITNTSNTNGTLNLNPVTIAGDPAFTIASQPAQTTLQPGEQTFFAVSFTPSVSDVVNATVTINSTDGSTTFIATGNGSNPLANVTLIDGTPIPSTGYDFGFLPQGQSETIEFLIQNTSPSTITFDGTALFDRAEFTAIPPEANTTTPQVIGPGETATFSVTYTAITINRVCGILDIPITNDAGAVDSISGTFCGGLPDQLTVLGDGQYVPAGDVTPRIEDRTDFESHPVVDPQPVTHEFTLFNNSPDTVTVDNIEIVNGPDNAGIFTVTNPVELVLTPGAVTEFSVTFTPLEAGPFQATIQVNSNASLVGSYQYLVAGTGLGPGVTVSGVLEVYNEETGQFDETSTQLIIDEETGALNTAHVPSVDDNTDFGQTPLGIPVQRRFRIANPGNAPLELTNADVMQLFGVSPDEWRLVFQPDTTLDPADPDSDEDETDFVLEFRAQVLDRDWNGGAELGYSSLSTNSLTFTLDLTDNTDAARIGFLRSLVIGQPNGAIIWRIGAIDPNLDSAAAGVDYWYITDVEEDLTTPNTARTITLAVDTSAGGLSGLGATVQVFDAASAPLPEAGTAHPVNASVRIDTNAAAEVHRPYVFNMTGLRYRTALTVQGLGTGTIINNGGVADYLNVLTIEHGDDDADESDFTDFAGVQVQATRTHSYVMRNDSQVPITLTGSPLVFVQGSNSDEFTVTVQNSYWDASASAFVVGAIDTGHVLDPGDYINFTISFTPADINLRAAEIVIPNSDPFPDAQEYRFAIHGRGLGPRLAVFGIDPETAALREISRGDTTPAIEDGTLLRPKAFIVNWATPPGAEADFFLTNIGNELLLLGDNTGVAIQATNIGLGFFLTTQPVLIDANTRQPILDATGGTIQADVLEPGEWATFTVLFDPEIGPPLPETGRQPEEDERRGVISIDTSDPPAFATADPDAFNFDIQGTAIDPDMEVLGQGELIHDLDFSPRIEDDTVYRDVDMWGGSKVHTFIVRNSGQFHPLLLRQPELVHEETIDAVPAYVVGTDGQSVNTIQVPGLTAGWDDADRNYTSNEILDQAWENGPYFREYSESVLSRIRIGDESSAGTVTGIAPFTGWIEQSPGVFVGLNLSPLDALPTGGAVPALTSNLMRPYDMNVPIVGSVTVAGNGLVASVSEDYFVFTKISPASFDSVQRRDTYVVNPSTALSAGITANDYLQVGNVFHDIINVVPGDNDGDFAVSVGLTIPFHNADYELPEHPHGELELVEIELVAESEDSFVFENDFSTQQSLLQVRTNCLVVPAGLDPQDPATPIWTVVAVDVNAGKVTVQQDLTGFNIVDVESWIRPQTSAIDSIIGSTVRFVLDPDDARQANMRSFLNTIDLLFSPASSRPILWNPSGVNPNADNPGGAQVAAEGTDYWFITNVTETVNGDGDWVIDVEVNTGPGALPAITAFQEVDDPLLGTINEAAVFDHKRPSLDVYYALPFIRHGGASISFVKKDFDVIGTLPGTLAPGESATFGLRVRPRWSTGFDKSMDFAAYPAPRALINYALTDLPANEAEIRYDGYGYPFFGNPEHQVEVNIDNTDADTWHDWDHELPPLFPFPAVGNDYSLDDIDPQYEWAVHVTSRDPQISVAADGSTVATSFNGPQSPAGPGGGTISFPLPIPIGETSSEIVFTIRNTPSDGSAVFITADNGTVAPLVIPGQAANNYNWRWNTIGNLELDEDQAVFLSGGMAGDFTWEILPADVDAADHVLFDPTYQLPVLGWDAGGPAPNDAPLLNTSVGPDPVIDTNQSLTFRLRFSPRGIGTRTALLNIPSNDASADPIQMVVQGVGLNPPTKANN